jgi:hypothetical protein
MTARDTVRHQLLAAGEDIDTADQLITDLRIETLSDAIDLLLDIAAWERGSHSAAGIHHAVGALVGMAARSGEGTREGWPTRPTPAMREALPRLRDHLTTDTEDTQT